MSFHWTVTSLVVSLATLVAAAGCCWLSWCRTGRTRRVAVLELFRLLLVALVLAMLNQPEMIRSVSPDTPPVVVVLSDVSGSMQTRDVSDEPSGEQAVRSRRQASESLANAHFRARDSAGLTVAVESFAAASPADEDGTDIAGALERTAEHYANLRGIVLVSDGDWNTGDAPHRAAAVLRMRGIPLFALPVGSEERLPDLALESVDAPTFGVAGQTLRIPFRLVNWMPEDRSVTLTLSGTNGDPITKTVRVGGMGHMTETIEWEPQQTAEYSLSLSIPVDPGETNADNNRHEFPVIIRHESLRVLLVDSFPRWEYRYLRNALERDPGVEVSCLLFHPDLDDVGAGRGYLEEFPGEQSLFEYDVVFLGDVGIEPGQLAAEDAERLRQLVRSHAGGLVFLPGFRGLQQSLVGSELEELLPVIPDPAQARGIGTARPGRFALTEFGRRSLLTRLESDDDDNERVWNTLPGFHWYAVPLRSRSGTQVLATHDSASTAFGRVPLIATRTAGTGKVLWMGTDGAWRWRKGREDLYHYRFWSQVVRWMAYQRKMSQGESMRLFHSPDRPESGKLLTLNANVMRESGEPLRNGTVTVQAVAPSGERTSVSLTATDDENWGLFTGSFVPDEGGVYQLTTVCQETGGRLETKIDVQGRDVERIGEPARPDVLRELAQITGGRVVPLDDAGGLLDEISALPLRRTDVATVRIWSHPLWGGLLIVLLGIFWSARKAAGLA